MRLCIRHSTVYRYARPVRFFDHHLLITPRPSHDVVLVSSKVTIEPAAELVWREDAAGNAAAIALFGSEASSLSIVAEHEVLHTAEPFPIYHLDPSAHRCPFEYSTADLAMVGPALLVAEPAETTLGLWVDRFRTSVSNDTLTLLKSLNDAVRNAAAYRVRVEEGTQAPAETLRSASGSCRDLATLFLAAARRLGFAARAASGYLHDPGASAGGIGATHAWCEVLLPGAGWVAFDPTRGRVGAAGLVTTAVGASSAAVLPIVGGYQGAATDFVGLDVAVEVWALEEHAAEGRCQT